MSQLQSTEACQLEAPPRELPENRSQWRFRPMTAATEWIEEYRPGGYHPVELGDVFEHKYRVMRKLGYGSYSTVWLARDTPHGRFVALKILKASLGCSRELDILGHLAEWDTTHTGSTHVLRLLDHFRHAGPNGTHECLVTEPLGPSVDELLHPPWRNIRDSTRYPTTVVREISRQALSGLAYLHKAGVIHGDVYGANLLFEIPGLDVATEEDILFDMQTPVESELVLRVDGHCPNGGDPWAPRRLLLSQPLRGTKAASRVDLTKPIIKFTDFGGAFKSGSRITSGPETPAPFRAPERIVARGVENTWDQGIDIWAMGCLIFSLVTRSSLVQLDGQDCATIDDDHLLQLHDTVGPLPRSITDRWDRHDLYFDAEGRQKRNAPVGYEVEFDHSRKHLEQCLLEMHPEDMGEAEVADLYAMLRKMLAYTPAQRPNAEELLKEAWIVAGHY